MKFVHYQYHGAAFLGALDGDTIYGSGTSSLASLLATGGDALQQEHQRLLASPAIDPATIEYLPPFRSPEKIVCVGLNYNDHARETGFQPPAYPALFSRFASSLIGHRSPIVRPSVSTELDYEGELAVIIGKAGHHIAKERALEHVAGYSIFNDASVRDYQFKSAQWMIGKNFDNTGAFGPVFVTADELPAAARGLRITTRLNGEVVQDASTADLIFDIPTLLEMLSEVMILRPGDVIVTGTPSGVGLAREPKLWMKPGDLCEVEIEGIGVLSNPVIQEPSDASL